MVVGRHQCVCTLMYLRDNSLCDWYVGELLLAMSVLYDLCGLICHQLPGRSSHFDGIVFPLCFRCSGLHFGVVSSYLYLAVSGGWKRSFPDVRSGVSASLLMVPFLLDGWGNTLHLWASPGWFRALTGLGMGMVLPLLLVPLIHQPAQITTSELKPSLSHPTTLIWPAIPGLIMVWFMMHPMVLLIFQLLTITVLVGILIFGINFLLVSRVVLTEIFFS